MSVSLTISKMLADINSKNNTPHRDVYINKLFEFLCTKDSIEFINSTSILKKVIIDKCHLFKNSGDTNIINTVNNLLSLLKVPLNIHKYKHMYGEKVENFEDVDDEQMIVVNTKDNIPIIDSETYNYTSPIEDFTFDPPSTVFIIRYKQKTYLINTEEFNFCFYTTPCIILNKSAII